MYQEAIDRLGASQPKIDGVALNALSQLAEVYRKQGRYQESSELLTGVMQTAAQVGETEASHGVRSYLARVFRDEEVYESAQQVTDEVLDYGLQFWQDQPLNIFNTLLELGAIYQAQGFLAEAEATFEEAWVGLTEVVGESHASTLVAMNNLGQIYEKQALGEEHTDTIAVRNNLAFLYMLMEEYEAAGEMFATIQEESTLLFGEDHQPTLKAMNNRGRVLTRLDQLPEAEQVALRAL